MSLLCRWGGGRNHPAMHELLWQKLKRPDPEFCLLVSLPRALSAGLGWLPRECHNKFAAKWIPQPNKAN